MNVSLYIAKRYLRAKSKNNAINFITILALVGVVLGSASLFVVLSGFSGLRELTISFSTVIDPDLKVVTAKGKTFQFTDTLKESVNGVSGIANYSKIIESRVIVSYDGVKHPGIIKGVDSVYQSIIPIKDKIYNGSWLGQYSPQVVVGKGVANRLSLGVLDYGKTATLYVPKGGKGQVSTQKEAFNMQPVTTIGLFDVNEEVNNEYVYTSFETAKNLLNFKGDKISALEIKLAPDADLLEVQKTLQSAMGNGVIVKTRAQLNDAVYKMLNTEHLVVYLIFTLVLIIALFNVIGSIIMMLLDKRSSMVTLYNVGATVSDIRNIFFLQGIIMSVVGGFIGLLIGYVIIQLQYSFSLIMIAPDLPYPVDITLGNFITVFITITVLGVVASKIASNRVTKDLLRTV